MNHHVVVSKLPVELLSLIFDGLSLQDLLTASRVSSFWRAVAFRHSRFWRDIKLTSLETPALDLFHARLDASTYQGIHIYVCVPTVEFPSRLCSVVLPALVRNLHRIEGLYFKLDIRYDVELFASLSVPAPHLAAFDVSFAHESRSSDALPANLFAGTAPKLQELQLQNVQLYPEHIPAAFANTSVLVYSFTVPQSFPTAVFAHCQALRKLHISGKHCSLAVMQDEPRLLPAHKLESFHMGTLTGSALMVERMPYASVPYTFVPLGDIKSARALLGHLRGRLAVEITAPPAQMILTYRSLATNTTRAFLAAWLQVDIGLPAAYITNDLRSRVDCISATSASVNLLGAFAYLPTCTRAMFTMMERCELKPPSKPLYAQELQEICISCPVAAKMTVAALELFPDSTFLPVSRIVRVLLDGVALDGDIGAISADRYLVSLANNNLATLFLGLQGAMAGKFAISSSMSDDSSAKQRDGELFREIVIQDLCEEEQAANRTDVRRTAVNDSGTDREDCSLVRVSVCGLEFAESVHDNPLTV
ncbi:hypothetical protein AURDEDRAFT_163389 [Auricularia subglabra TFB-10046 SS5]|nr:hypothetical protein AURDEDRAFT_163389 [Auricularia subglabra TFB-10046 SS5]